MFNIRRFVDLFVLTNVFVVSQYAFYQDQDKLFAFNVKENLNFTETRKYCKSFYNGELAMIKDRNLAEKIEEALFKALKQVARK